MNAGGDAAEQSSDDMYASIDGVEEIIVRQIIETED